MLAEGIWKTITEYKLILPGEQVFVGLSGGADSVCLLLLLEELGEVHGFSVQAVHVNHTLRGEESDGDEAYVRELCRQRGIPLHCFSRPVEETAKERQIGIEEAGREVRAEIFRLCEEQYGADRIALAHHRQDQAETVLFRLARGSSLTGLAGIRPLQGRVIHPLLFTDKAEIIGELERRGISWRTDSSNLTDHYTRNCIRHQVLPVLENRVNSRYAAHIAEAAEDLAEADAYLREQAAAISGRCVEQRENGTILLREMLLSEPPILRRYVLLDALGLAAGSRRNLGREQIRQLDDLLKGEAGRSASLPGKMQAVRNHEGLLLKKQSAEPGGQAESAGEPVPIPGPGEYTFGSWKISCELLTELPEEIPENRFTKWLDYDKIKDKLVVRTRESGDFIVTTKEGGRKKLKAYFIDEKIPAEQRREIPLLASGSGIFWVMGYRISEDCKMTAQTERCLKISLREGKL